MYSLLLQMACSDQLNVSELSTEQDKAEARVLLEEWRILGLAKTSAGM